MVRLFVGLIIPEEARGRLAYFLSGLPGGRWVDPQNMRSEEHTSELQSH